VEEGMAITAQEAWMDRAGRKTIVPDYLRETIELVAFLAREDKGVDKRSGVSQRLPIACLETAISNAEQRASRNGEHTAIVRVADLYASLPALTGKLELEYEGELKGAETIARELIRAAIGRVFSHHLTSADFQPVIHFFEMGGELMIPTYATSEEALGLLRQIQGLLEFVDRLGVSPKSGAAHVSAAGEFILEGLWSHKRISRSEERGFFAEKQKSPEPREPINRPPRRQYN
jgi:magnesium chelatase subunit I